MSERRQARGHGALSDCLPEHLTWQGAEDPRWWDSGTAPHGLERFAAHRRHREARRAYLARMTMRPRGVGDVEWAEAHRAPQQQS